MGLSRSTYFDKPSSPADNAAITVSTPEQNCISRPR
jgi:hypothetical protein